MYKGHIQSKYMIEKDKAFLGIVRTACRVSSFHVIAYTTSSFRNNLRVSGHILRSELYVSIELINVIKITYRKKGKYQNWIWGAIKIPESFKAFPNS